MQIFTLEIKYSALKGIPVLRHYDRVQVLNRIFSFHQILLIMTLYVKWIKQKTNPIKAVSNSGKSEKKSSETNKT